MSESVPGPAAVVPAAPSTPFDPQSIIAELDKAFEYLPETAIRAARANRDVMVPRLIQAIQAATAKVRAGENVDGNAHFFALLMLTEFRAREALPAILEAVSLPGQGPFDLFEDAITSLLAGILVTLSDDPLALIDGMIPNADLNQYVRWEAAQAYVYLVRDGRLSREQAVEHLRLHLRREIDAKDQSEIVTGLVCVLSDLAAREAYEEIKEALQAGLVDGFTMSLEDVDRQIAEGEAGVQQRLGDLRLFDDTIEELRYWASFEPSTTSEPESEPEPRFLPEIPARQPEPRLLPESWANQLDTAGHSKTQPLRVAATKRVGRNDPCPCGSGKKYKKCCLDKDRLDQ